MGDSAHTRLDSLRAQALAAAEGLMEGEQVLNGVLRDIQGEKQRVADAYRAVVRSLAVALEARDGYTGGHSDEVQRLATAVASRLGLPADEIDEIRTVALLHDIGKIGIPDSILHKPARLTADELAIMREHPVIGERILSPLPGFSTVATAVRHEHERWDGAGYPDGLAGDAIPLASRVVLACDAWHALVSDRPYRKALPFEDAIAEVERCSGTQFDPDVVEAMLICVREPLTCPDEDDSEHGAGPAESRHELELRALITVAAAVAAAHALDDVIEIAAEEARRALGAGSLSISRLEREPGHLRTLINVGELAPGEERHPTDELYPLGDFPRLVSLLENGQPHLAAVDDPECDASERELLRALNKVSAVAVPIVFGDGVWGELYASRGPSENPFSEREVRFLQTISGQIGAAIGRAELFSGIAELAFEDSLTGLANRRALDERLEAAVAAAVADGHDMSLVLCDLDNLKDVNDSLGHQAGDEALVRAARVLDDKLGAGSGGLVARIGGDEFCIVLERTSADEARELTEAAMEELADSGESTLTLSCGIASVRGGGGSRPADLIRAADAAQYTAKRTGRRRVCIARGDAPVRARGVKRRAVRERDAVERHRLLEDVVGQLDSPSSRGLGPPERLALVAGLCAETLGAPAWSVSVSLPGTGTLSTISTLDRRAHDMRFDVEGESYELARYPQSAAVLDAGGTFVVSIEDDEADPEERALLEDWGMECVLVTGAPAPDARWMVELYGHDETSDLHTAAPIVRLLVAEAVRGACDWSPHVTGALRLP
jgi:diguanylate cyclase (GGDEF)-like protein